MNDSQIIALYFNRDELAIKETDAVYGRKLHTLSTNILNSREDADECVSDTYMKTWNSIPPTRPLHFYAFLVSICRNLSLNKLDWKMAAKRNAEVVSLTLELENCIPDNLHNTEMERRELQRLLEQFLETISKESRVIFLRRYLYADTIAEIASQCQISESKVKTQLHRIRRKLYNHLKMEGIDL